MRGAGWVLLLAFLCPLSPNPAGAHTPEEKTFYLQSRVVLRLNPRDARAGNAVGTWQLEYNELVPARAAFGRVLRNHPEDFLAAAGLALIDEAEGAPGAALERVARIAKFPAAFAPFLALVRGRLLFRSGRVKEAEAALRGALKGAPDPHGVYLWLGKVREAADDPAGAIAMFRKAVEADPSWMEPYARLAVIHRRQGRPRLARQVLDSAAYAENPSPYPNNDIRVLWSWVMRAGGARG